MMNTTIRRGLWATTISRTNGERTARFILGTSRRTSTLGNGRMRASCVAEYSTTATRLGLDFRESLCASRSKKKSCQAEDGTPISGIFGPKASETLAVRDRRNQDSCLPLARRQVGNESGTVVQHNSWASRDMFILRDKMKSMDAGPLFRQS